MIYVTGTLSKLSKNYIFLVQLLLDKSWKV